MNFPLEPFQFISCRKCPEHTGLFIHSLKQTEIAREIESLFSQLALVPLFQEHLVLDHCCASLRLAVTGLNISHLTGFLRLLQL